MPINGQIKRWAVTSAPAEHAEILGRWELFTNMRMLTALAAFGLLRRDEEGRGVLDSPETPGGCFGHFSDIQMTGFRTLAPGQQVDLTWEAPGFKQGGTTTARWPSCLGLPDIYAWYLHLAATPDINGGVRPRSSATRWALTPCTPVARRIAVR